TQTAVTAGQAPATGTRAAARALTAPRHPTAFVVNSGGTVTPIGLTTRRAGKPIKVGANPQAIAITPDGKTAFVANYGSNSVTPIQTPTPPDGTPHPGRQQPRGEPTT